MGACLHVSSRDTLSGPAVTAAVDTVAPTACIFHGHAEPLLSLRCDACLASGTPSACGDNGFCTACILSHSLSYPTLSSSLDASSLRLALAALLSTSAPGWDSSTSSIGPSAAKRATNATYTSPLLVDRVRQRVLAIQAELDALEANESAALAQLMANRETALAVLDDEVVAGVDAAQVVALFSSGIDATHAAAAVKRAGLEAELVTADEALAEAIEATAAIAEAATALDDANIVQLAPALFARLAAAQAAVAAIPAHPATSSFLLVKPAPGPEVLRADFERRVGDIALAWSAEPPGPADLSPEHAAWLQSQLPTNHGFHAEDFHARCDGRARLLVLVRAREGGWLFGGFSTVRTIPGSVKCYADPAAFVFSLTNALGHPEKLESTQKGHEVKSHPWYSATFGGCPFDLHVCSNADSEANSCTQTGWSFAASASTGAHPMARGYQGGWCAAEVVVWAV